jgi:ATP-dependent Zn protease
MGGGAAEAAVFGDRPLRSAASDLASARSLAHIVCRNEGSRSFFIEHCYQEALAVIEENKLVVLALAQALIDHPVRTLNAAEIDAVISQTLAREALYGSAQPKMPPASPRH